MGQQIINTGLAPDDHLGETLRSAMTKVNQNFTEVYSKHGAANVYVYQSGGFTTAVNLDGTVISSLTTTASNNVTVLNAATAAAAGSFVSGGYGHGGLVQVSADEYQINGQINIGVGTSFAGVHRAFDRGGATYNATTQSAHGTTFTITAANVKAIALGTSTTGPGVHLATNPHGASVSNFVIDGNAQTGAIGVYMCDVTDLRLERITIMDCTTGIEVDSTQQPNAGGTVACKIINCDILGASIAIDIGGTVGGTDGEVTSCRILSHKTYGINLQAGGWQISQCHFTTGQNANHILCNGSPSMITNNYFDSSGASPHIVLTKGNVNITGNYFIASSAPVCIDITSSSGCRSSIVGNTTDLGTGTFGFIRLPGSSFTSVPLIAVGNSVDYHVDPASFVASIVTSTNTAVPDTFVATPAVDPPSISANTVAQVAVTVSGVSAGDVITGEPPTALEAGLIPIGYIASANTITILLANITAGAINGASRTWTFRIDQSAGTGSYLRGNRAYIGA